MAKDSTKKKAKSVNLGEGVKIKVKVGKKGGSKKSGKSKKPNHNPIEALARLAESPIIADLIAVGATAAVAALAGHGTAGSAKGNAAKNAGKAAAAAIGARLMSEFNAVKASAKDAAAKSSAKKA